MNKQTIQINNKSCFQQMKMIAMNCIQKNEGYLWKRIKHQMICKIEKQNAFLHYQSQQQIQDYVYRFIKQLMFDLNKNSNPLCHKNSIHHSALKVNDQQQINQQINMLNTKLKRREKQIKTKNINQMKLEKTMVQFYQKLSNQQNHIKHLRQQIQKKTQQNRMLRLIIDNLATHLTKNIQKSQKQLSCLKEKLYTQKLQNLIMMQKNRKLNEIFLGVQAQIQKISQQIEVRLINDFFTKASRIQQRQKRHLQEINNLSSQVSNHRHEMNQFNVRAQKINKMNYDLQNYNLSLQKQIIQKNQQFCLLSQQYAHLKSQNILIGQKLVYLQKTVQFQRTKNLQKNQQIVHLKRELIKLQRQQQYSGRQVQSMHKQLRNLQTNLFNEKNKQKSQQKQINIRFNQLNREFQQINKQNNKTLECYIQILSKYQDYLIQQPCFEQIFKGVGSTEIYSLQHSNKLQLMPTLIQILCDQNLKLTERVKYLETQLSLKNQWQYQNSTNQSQVQKDSDYKLEQRKLKYSHQLQFCSNIVDMTLSILNQTAQSQFTLLQSASNQNIDENEQFDQIQQQDVGVQCVQILSQQCTQTINNQCTQIIDLKHIVSNQSFTKTAEQNLQQVQNVLNRQLKQRMPQCQALQKQLSDIIQYLDNSGVQLSQFQKQQDNIISLIGVLCDKNLQLKKYNLQLLQTIQYANSLFSANSQAFQHSAYRPSFQNQEQKLNNNSEAQQNQLHIKKIHAREQQISKIQKYVQQNDKNIEKQLNAQSISINIIKNDGQQTEDAHNLPIDKTSASFREAIARLLQQFISIKSNENHKMASFKTLIEMLKPNSKLQTSFNQFINQRKNKSLINHQTSLITQSSKQELSQRLYKFFIQN